MIRSLVLASALAMTAAAAFAQAASAPASSPAKKALVAKIVQLQQPGIENMARQLVERPAAELLSQVGAVLQRMPADKRDALAKDVQADARKYVDDTLPAVRKRALELAPQAIGPILEERFTEDELKQIVAILESPVNKKFLQAAPEMQKSLGEKIINETRASVEPKVRALQQTVAKRLQPAAPQPAASSAKP